MKKVLFFFLTSLLFFTQLNTQENKPSSSFEGCNYPISKDYFNSIDKLIIEKIEVDTHNYRSWIVNSIRILTSGTRFISDDQKRRFDSTITVTYNDGTKCVLEGQIRQSGDAKDHIAYKGNSVIQSLDINLKYGNIKGITKFKLYKPDVRGVLEDVIIQTQLLRNFNYLAPRSIKVDARVNEMKSVMLFQEKASKELLEFNKRREGPILEADQKFFFNLVRDIPDNQLSNWSIGKPFFENKTVKVMLAKQTNANIVNRGNIHKKISLEALTNLNLIYLYYANRFKDEKNDFFYFDYDLDNSLLAFFDPEKTIKLHGYNLFLQATNSHHGLSVSNRKFYWNSIENYYEPVNYDANPGIDSDFSTTTTASFRLPVPENFLESFELIEKKLSIVDLDRFYNQMNVSGLNLSKDEVKAKIEKIKTNLGKIKEDYIKSSKAEVIEHNKFKPIDNILGKFNESLTEIDPNAFLIKNAIDNNSLKKCKIYLEDCKDLQISDEEFTEMLEGELKIDNSYYQYLGKNLNLENFANDNRYSKLQIGTTTIFFENGIKIFNNISEKKVDILQTKAGSRAFIIGGELKNILIDFQGLNIVKNTKNYDLEKFPENFPINSSGLTGCLSFINIKLSNVDIESDYSSCEDSINFINASGNVNNILIKNAFSDALDVDFSNLRFKNITINSARNDCVDFSAGNYQLNYLDLNKCGDKGLSIGEKSNISLSTIDVINANIGIAVKDSSILTLEKANLKNLETCVSAYNKKQEYDGGILEMKEFNCENFYTKADIDELSKIFLKDEIFKNHEFGNSYNPVDLTISQVDGKKINKNFIKDFKTFNKDESLNVVVEIPLGINEKWQVSKLNGSLVREFYMGAPRLINFASYPINYGMIPRTLLPVSRGGDGDPLDVILLGDPLKQGQVVKAKPIGMMTMNDNGDQDDKIIAIPLNDELFGKVNDITDLKESYPDLLNEIKIWFENYKGNNVVEFLGFKSAQKANELIQFTERHFKRTGIKPRS